MRSALILKPLVGALLAGALLAAAPLSARDVLPQASLDTAAQLRERALGDATAYALIESLTTEIGPRLPGSEADARAVAWAKARFEALGYDISKIRRVPQSAADPSRVPDARSIE